MRLTVPQIADVPTDLQQEVDRAIDADLVEEGFARIARVLNGGIGIENLAPGFAFAAADFQLPKHVHSLSVTHTFWGDPIVEPTWLPLGSTYAASTVISLRLVCGMDAPVADFALMSAVGGVFAQIGANLTRLPDPPAGRYPQWINMGVSLVTPYEYGLTGTPAIPAGRALFLRVSNTAAATPAYLAGTVHLTAMHQS